MKRRKKILVLLALMVTMILGGSMTAYAESKKCPECGTTLKSYMPDGWAEANSKNHVTYCPGEGCDYEIWQDPCTLVAARIEIVYYNNDPVKYKYWSPCHRVYVKCSDCGTETGVNNSYTEAHAFDKETNKCKCGFEQIIPGNTKITSAKQSGKMKTIKGTIAGFWYKTYSGNSKIPTWHYQKPTKYNNKGYKIKFKLKKAKNVDYYQVSTKKNPEASTTAKQQFKKTSFTYNYISKKKVKKVTLYVTPVSKTGNYGKTVKKTIKLK